MTNCYYGLIYLLLNLFLKNSKVDVYMRMWNFMQSWGPSVFVKNNEEGVKKVRYFA
jgi:hypothetical protein